MTFVLIRYVFVTFCTESNGIAIGAAKKVKIIYSDVKPPILTVEDAIAQKSFFPKPCDDWIVGNAEGQ